VTSPRSTDTYLTWISTFLRGGEKLARLQWTADDRIVFAEVVDRETGEEAVLFDVPAAAIARANVTLQWLRLFLDDGRDFQVDLNNAVPADLVARETDGDADGDDIFEGVSLPSPQTWAEELRAEGVPVKVTGVGAFFGFAGLAAVGIMVVVGVVVASML
jgi:hypothetical protein